MIDELNRISYGQARRTTNQVSQASVEAVEPRGYYRVRTASGRVIQGVKGEDGISVGQAIIMASSGSGQARRWNVLADGYTRNQTIEEVVV